MPANRDPNLNIEIPKVYHFTGIRPWQVAYTVKTLLGIEERNTRYVILFEWDAALSYLGLDASWGAGKGEQFHSTVAQAAQQLVSCGVKRDDLPRFLRPNEELRPSKRFLIAEVPSEAMLTLTFRIDTDQESYLTYAQALKQLSERPAGRPTAPAGPLPGEPRLIVTAYARQGERAAEQGAAAQRAIQVQLTSDRGRPARTMDAYDGFVAIDLGNTTTTLVSLAGDSEDPRDIHVVGAETTVSAEPTTRTAVRIQNYKPGAAPPSRSGQPQPLPIAQAGFLIGDVAMRPGSGWLVLGPKRLLADPDVATEHQLWLTDRKVSIPKRVPAELFVTGMLRAFHQAESRYVSRLAVTCPTTFSDREQAQLKRVIYDAWRRSLGWKHQAHDPAGMAKRIPLVIDEASAAAYFFIYRDFVNAPGGLRGFNYRYPRGLNVLLYDCGGGTTDISLVQATPRPVEDEVRCLDMEVLGRTGLRGFGGDNITVAVFCLLQAKLAAALSGLPALGRGSGRLSFPADDVTAIPAFLEEQRAAIARLVPLQFDPKRVDHDDQRRRMEATMELWVWAEQFKCALGSEDPSSLDYVADSRLVALLVQSHSGLQPADCDRILKQIKLHHTEVDELVRGEIDRSIDKANHLLTAKLPPGTEVHRVYVVGNAARYALIRERLKQRLKVRFLQDDGNRPGRLIFDESNLKNAVSKGAVLALRQSEVAGGATIRFDNKLITRLPFDIVYLDQSTGEERVQYPEHKEYHALDEKIIPTPRFDEGGVQSNRLVLLKRRWPGDDKGERFLSFTFEENVTGPLELSYVRPEYGGNAEEDATALLPHFLLKDKGNYGQEVKGVEWSEASYCSPPQQGTISTSNRGNGNG